MLRNMSVARKLPLLVGVIGGGFAIYAVVALVVLGQLKIGGTRYNAIALDNALLADVLPPPAYLVEADLTAHQLLSAARAGDAPARAEIEQRLTTLEQTYHERLTFWRGALRDPQARAALLERSEPAAAAFFDVLHEQVVAAIDDGRLDDAAAAVDGPLQQAYDQHRSAIDEVVQRAQVAATERELSAHRAASRWSIGLVVALIAVLVVSGVLARLISRSIIGPLAALRRGLEAVAAGADVDTVRVDSTRGDEVGAVALAFNTFADRMSTRVRELDAHAAVLVDVASSMEEAAESVCAGMSMVASATTEMDAAIIEISRTASDAARVATDAVGAVDNAVGRMDRLQSSASSIAEAVITIGQITDKTHLLALNAHIEAEHAGDSGRGFAVVAHEVKELARRTGQTTNTIGSVVAATGDDVMAAIDAMRQISVIIADVNEASIIIAAAVEEQTATMREIVGQVEMAAGKGIEIRHAVRNARRLGA